MSLTLKNLDQISVGLEDIAKTESMQKISTLTNEVVTRGNAKLSKVGQIGISVDFSDNQPQTPFQDEFPLTSWVLNTSMARSLEANKRAGKGYYTDLDSGERIITVPHNWYTLPPTDTTGECCWTPLELGKCGGKAPLRLLCLKYCNDILNTLIDKVQRFQPTDLTNYFQRPGETVEQAQDRMNRYSMRWFSARTITLGTIDTETPTLKPFPGILGALEKPGVFHIDGSVPLAAFESMACRWANLGKSNETIVGLHPLTLESIKKLVVPGRFGDLPEGWTKNGENLSFKGVTFVADKLVPVDLTAGTGEAWILDGEIIGGVMGTTLDVQNEDFIIRTGENNNDPDSGCATKCTYYYNWGAVVQNNPNKLAVIKNIPISSACLGNTLLGTESLINPNTPVPKLT